MKANRHRPHLHILPEDDANRQIAKGFASHVSVKDVKMQVLPEAHGWGRVLDEFDATHSRELKKYPNRFLVLLIDFDEDGARRQLVQSRIPADLLERVFVIGVWSEPERLKSQLGSYETIGNALAEDCFRDTNTTWSHSLLEHNTAELVRLREQVRPFLFEVT
ncbi:MAG: hypothetical protein EXQ57_08490 [Bryobacterales bacterium]|nr:hypothetical protein [Bryobacterales bacterium]